MRCRRPWLFSATCALIVAGATAAGMALNWPSGVLVSREIPNPVMPLVLAVALAKHRLGERCGWLTALFSFLVYVAFVHQPNWWDECSWDLSDGVILVSVAYAPAYGFAPLLRRLRAKALMVSAARSKSSPSRSRSLNAS